MDDFSKATPVKVSEHLIRFDMLGGSQHVYLLIGKKRAALIDTGWGPCNFAEMVKDYTDLPVMVINTHGHGDHVGGNPWFECAYMHRNAIFDMINGVIDDYNKIPFNHKNYEKRFLDEGEVLDLGGITLKVLYVPAHSVSSIMLLCKEERILFSGDEIEGGQVLYFGANVKDIACLHKANMLKLLGESKDFDTICPGHNMFPVSADIIHDFIQLDEKLIDGSAEMFPLDHPFLAMNKNASHMQRVRFGKASVIYYTNL